MLRPAFLSRLRAALALALRLAGVALFGAVLFLFAQARIGLDVDVGDARAGAFVRLSVQTEYPAHTFIWQYCGDA